MASRLECSRLAGDTLVWQTLQLESGRVPLSDSCQYLLSRRSTFTCLSLRTCKLQTQDLLCSVIVMESFISRLKQKGFIVSFNPKGDGSCFFSAAAHQLNQDGARLKDATFAYLLSHRFDVSISLIVITSIEIDRKRILVQRGNISYEKGKSERLYKLAFCFTLHGSRFMFSFSLN